MSFSLKTTVMATVLSGLLSILSPAYAKISPDIRALLTMASQKDGGTNLDMVAALAVAANPAATRDIQQFVTRLKQKESKPVTPQEVDFFDLHNWSGGIDLTYLRSSGNTRQESLGLAGKLKLNSGRYHHIIRSFFDLNKNTGVTDKQRWGLSYKLDYDFSEKLYATSFAGYENNQFGAFRERITTALGIGYPVINTDHYNWKIEGGPGLLFTKDLPGKKYSHNLSVFASSIFNWTINDRSNFTNTTKFYIGNKNIIESKTALKVKINGSLSSKFSYNIMYDRGAPPSRQKTDAVARAGLSYDF